MTRAFTGPGRKDSFTLVEMLVTIFIIAILAALTLAASEGVMKTAGRNRAKAEIQAISANLENFKADNGLYPRRLHLRQHERLFHGGRQLLRGSLSAVVPAPLPGLVRPDQFIGCAGCGQQVLHDFQGQPAGKRQGAGGNGGVGVHLCPGPPFGYSYGYYTGDAAPAGTSVQANPPISGSGSYDLWSTGGALYTPLNFTNSWISNWAPQ